jgi:hypothetical protein
MCEQSGILCDPVGREPNNNREHLMKGRRHEHDYMDC